MQVSKWAAWILRAGQSADVMARLRLRPIAARIATDAFGNALGNSIADSMGRGAQQTEVLSEAQRQRQALEDYYRDMEGSLVASDSSRFAEDVARDIEGSSVLSGSQGLRATPNNTVPIPPLSVMPAARDDGLNLEAYKGNPVAFTVAKGQGVLGAMASAGFNEAQRRAMYGQLVRDGTLDFGEPVYLGDTFYVDLADMSAKTLGDQLIAAESRNRAALAAAAAQGDAQTATNNYLGTCTPNNASAAAVLPIGGSPGAFMSAWDGKSGVPQASAQHPFYGTWQYPVAIGVQDAVGAIAAPEIVAAKMAPLVAGITASAGRLFGVAEEAAVVASSASRTFTYNAVENPGPLALLPGKPAGWS